MEIELKILDPRIELPQYATPGAAAIDLRACSVHETDCPASLPQNPLAAAYTAYPGERLLIGTGIALHMDGILREMDGDMRDFATVGALILPRSSLGKLGITLGNAPGLVDADYTGEIKLALWNASGATFSFSPLERLAQLVIVPVIRPGFRVVAEFSQSSQRGDGGFGSTGRL